MSLQFYKPNAKSTGTACSFWRKPEDNTFWASFIKQESWNSKTRTGSFSKNKDNPKKRAIVKFNDLEFAGIIDAIERSVEYSGYHASQRQIVKFKFCPYLKDGKQVGFSFSVQKEDKEDSTDKQSYIIGFYFPEAMRLKIYLMTVLSESYNTVETVREKVQESIDSQPQEEYDF